MAAMIPGLIALIPTITSLLGRFFPNQDVSQAAIELATMTESYANANKQLDVNAVEASNASIFVAGWRPFVGWVGGAAFAYQAILLPLILFIAACFNLHPAVPPFDLGLLQTVLMGMLGMGGLRTFEKIRGVADTQVNTHKHFWNR